VANCKLLFFGVCQNFTLISGSVGNKTDTLLQKTDRKYEAQMHRRVLNKKGGITVVHTRTLVEKCMTLIMTSASATRRPTRRVKHGPLCKPSTSILTSDHTNRLGARKSLRNKEPVVTFSKIKLSDLLKVRGTSNAIRLKYSLLPFSHMFIPGRRHHQRS
jgi:hypothetical protein